MTTTIAIAIKDAPVAGSAARRDATMIGDHPDLPDAAVPGNPNAADDGPARPLADRAAGRAADLDRTSVAPGPSARARAVRRCAAPKQAALDPKRRSRLKIA
jgi:hypothetical protein